ncbi:permease [Marinomonas sp. GJ51-6]|uniref:permease n=1 Tax=Marinomonas sp. GJ51-6 TaxID=2992802 RepID=UPI0029352EC7|nr:permease [Marinomonas sp. GJ51-6]WOD09137.1 permease [Marinomonas sp. GJ51-6]
MGALLGSLFGMLTPFCSASVVPVTMGMATMGVSLGTVLSFLISAPLCNFVVLAMVYVTFGFKVTASYLAITFIAAVFGGWLITKTPWRNEIKRGEELLNEKKPSRAALQLQLAVLHQHLIKAVAVSLTMTQPVNQVKQNRHYVLHGHCLKKLFRMS